MFSIKFIRNILIIALVSSSIVFIYFLSIIPTYATHGIIEFQIDSHGILDFKNGMNKVICTAEIIDSGTYCIYIPCSNINKTIAEQCLDRCNFNTIYKGYLYNGICYNDNKYYDHLNIIMILIIIFIVLLIIGLCYIYSFKANVNIYVKIDSSPSYEIIV